MFVGAAANLTPEQLQKPIEINNKINNFIFFITKFIVKFDFSTFSNKIYCELGTYRKEAEAPVPLYGKGHKMVRKK